MYLAQQGLGRVGAGPPALRGTFRMRYTPPELLARTTSTSSLVNFGTMPLAGLAALAAGWLGTPVGVRETVTAMAALFAASAVAPLFGPYGRLRDLPGQPMATCSSGSTATARKTTVT